MTPQSRCGSAFDIPPRPTTETTSSGKWSTEGDGGARLVQHEAGGGEARGEAQQMLDHKPEATEEKPPPFCPLTTASSRGWGQQFWVQQERLSDV